MKQETFEEIRKYAELSYYNGDEVNAFINGAKWQAERMYSEEDMIEFGEWCENLQRDNKDIRRNNPDITRKELFETFIEQFKKKQL